MAPQPWIPAESGTYIQNLAQQYAATDLLTLETELDRLIAENRTIHEDECINLNPATNVMNPKAEAILAQGLGSRPSLGYPGDKYEMGLEAVEKIEVLAAELACEIFNANFAEIRVASGAMANLYAFMATGQPGDRIIVPSDAIGGHITHHRPGAAGLYGLEIHPAPIDAENYTVAVDALRRQAQELRPKLITIGGSLNLFPHPVADIRAIADEAGARVLFDAAHLSGLIAGGAWPNPLDEGAHLMTMSAYKSLGGPAAGLIVTNEPALAERLDQIAFPGLTANFDVAKSASLAMSLLDWKATGPAYAAMMAETALALAKALAAEGMPVFAADQGITQSHQFAIEAAAYGGGQTAAKLLRRANILSCGIGLPIDPVEGDLNGLRLGTPEIVRWGFRPENMRKVAGFISRVLVQGEAPETVASDVTEYRQKFQQLHFIRS
ncbi:MAG: aminotransferase class I/II-fold pyridoxal phosphate-dependent enzyme [Anaerolineae bacterium]|nr:aminotransferase class I/II-fold pyridoxal phosphate-dependent enzyme [Anaerolineae bacterium]